MKFNGSIDAGSINAGEQPETDAAQPEEHEADDNLFPAPEEIAEAESERELADRVDTALPKESAWFVKEVKDWYVWNGETWTTHGGILRNWIGRVGHECFVGKQGENPQTGGRYATAVNVLNFLAGRPPRRKDIDGWDANRNILGLPSGGILEIGPGKVSVRQQRREDHVTQSLPFAPAESWELSDFHRYLQRVCPDEEMQAWLQRALGYGLACDGSEDVFVWLRGSKRSGKSTLAAYLRGAAPQHFARLASDVLMQRSAQRHMERIARLHDKRFVYWAEAQSDGGLLDVETLKAWTGDDPLTGNFMRRNSFDFLPKFILILISNNDLQIGAPDTALYARTRLVDPPWTTIPDDEQLLDVRQAAHAGDPAFLRWMAEGAAAWRAQRAEDGKTGLLPETEKMKADREEWQRNADHLSQFLYIHYEKCDAPEHPVKRKNLHTHYLEWYNENVARGAGLAFQAFNRRVAELGFREVPAPKWSGSRVRGWNMRKIQTPQDEPDYGIPDDADPPF